MPLTLNTISEDFLYERLPQGVIEEDARNVIKAVCGGLQDRVEDLRTFSSHITDLMNPRSNLPEVKDNALAVIYQGQSETGTITRNVDSDLLANLTKVHSGEVQEDITYAVLGGTGVVYNSVTYVNGDLFIGVEDVGDYTTKDGTEQVYAKNDLYSLILGKIDVDEKLVVKIKLVTDVLRLVSASTLQHLADTIGAVLYGTASSTEDFQRILTSYFPRLKVKGTRKSYEILSRLVGFKEAKMTALWGRLSPRLPNDVGASVNDPDFSAGTEFEPSVESTADYDPNDAADGPFFSWNSPTLSSVRTDTNFYEQAVNGFNPFIKVIAGTSSEVSHPPTGIYELSGGGPHKKAELEIPDTGLIFQALVEGTSFNELRLVFSEAPGVDAAGTPRTDRVIQILARLSTRKYRTSYFNLSLFKDLISFQAKHPNVAVGKNSSLSENPGLVPDGTAQAPYRPWTGGVVVVNSTTTAATSVSLTDTLQSVGPGYAGYQLRIVSGTGTGQVRQILVSNGQVHTVSPAWDTIPDTTSGYWIYKRIQAPGTAKQLDIGSLLEDGIHALQYFDELRTATRFPRELSFGFSVDEPVLYAPFLDRTLLFTTSGSPPGGGGDTYAGTATTTVLEGSYTADVAALLTISGVLTRSNPSQDFTIGVRSSLPVIPGTVQVKDVDTSALIAHDDGNGVLLTDTADIISGSVDYDTGEIILSSADAYNKLQANVYYGFYRRLTAEQDSTSAKINYAADSVLAGFYNFQNDQFSFLNSGAGIGINVPVYALWRTTSTEIIRETEPSAQRRTPSSVPEDEPDQPEGYALQVSEDNPWLRPLLTNGEEVDIDSYLPAEPDARKDDVGETMVVIDHRGVEYDIFGHDATAEIPDTPIRTTLVERPQSLEEYRPGQLSLATVGSDIYTVGLAQGVLVADLGSFFNPSHHTGLVGWIPFNQHPGDDLKIKDHSAVQSTVDSVNIFPQDRVWDSKRGWTLLLWPSANVTATGYRKIDSTFSFSFWLRPTLTTLSTPVLPIGAAQTGGTLAVGTYHFKVVAVGPRGVLSSASPNLSVTLSTGQGKVLLTWTTVLGAVSYRIYKGTSSTTHDRYFTSGANSFLYETDTTATLGAVVSTVELLNYGPLQLTLGLGTNVFKVRWKLTSGSYQDVASLSLTNNAFKFLALTKTGNTFTFYHGDLTTAVTVVSGAGGSYQDFTADDLSLSFQNPGVEVQLHDLRLWNTLKSEGDLNRIRNYGFKKSSAAYLSTYFLSLGRQARWGLTVLDSGYVVPAALPLSQSDIFYQPDGSDSGSTRLKVRYPTSRVIRYNDEGRFSGEARFKKVGFGNGPLYSNLPSPWKLGTRIYSMAGSGFVVVSTDIGAQWVDYYPAPSGTTPAHRLVYTSP
jgi:hypothetical protein